MEGYNHWAVTPTGDYCADYATGRRLGIEYLRHSSRQTMHLGWIMDDMPEKLGGMELGFLRIVGSAASLGYVVLADLGRLDLIETL